MALFDQGGLDAQVEQRMDAYRGNPQQLQKRYGANKELLDLLALQKLTSEKKAVAADMQLKQSQQPGTIAQQREQEALDLTKQEMSGTLGQLAANTKGTLDQKQATQTQNMNKMAQDASRPRPGAGAGLAGLMGGGARPQARPPQGGGVEGMLMARNAARRGGPQSGPVRMAQGGIVSFAGADGNNEVKSPFGRLVDSGTNAYNKWADLGELRKQVKQKYFKYGTGSGLFTQMTPEAQKYAGDIMKRLPTLTAEELQAALNVDFDPASATALPPLESLSTGEQPPQDTVNAADPLAIVESEAPEIDSGTGNVTFLPAEQEDFFKDVQTSYQPVVPQAADTARLDASITEMTDQAGDTPKMGDVSPLTAAPLEAVAAPYDEQGQEILRSLNKRYASDMAADPASAMQNARASSDTYFDREGKAKTYAQQEADERALQGETLDPARLKRLADMQTLAGGRRGSGGMGSAYVAAQRAQDELRGGGLKTLRSIQDTGMASDTGIASYGAQSGENAGSRAEARRRAGITGARGLLTDQENRALQGQREQNTINIENKRYERDVATGDFNAAREALSRQGDALRQVVSVNSDDVNNQVRVNVSSSEDQNKARAAAVEQELEVAKAKSEERLKLNEKLFTSEVELQKLADTRAKNVTSMITEAMLSNPQAVALEQQLMQLSQTENRVEYDRVNAELNKIKRATIETLTEMYSAFADNYADMITLNQRIQQIRAANTAVQSMPRRLDPNDVSISELPTGPQ